MERVLNIATEAGDQAGVRLTNHYLKSSYLAPGNVLKATVNRGVGAHTGEAAEGPAYNINGNFYRPFCEFGKQ